MKFSPKNVNTRSVPNDANPSIPDGATQGQPVGFAPEKDEISDSPTPAKEELKAVGADYEQTNEVPNDANPKIPAGAPAGEPVGFVPDMDKQVNASPATENDKSAVGEDTESKNEVPNDANPSIPAGAPAGSPAGFDLPTSIRKDDTRLTNPAQLDASVENKIETGVDTSLGHADSKRQADAGLAPAPDATLTSKKEPSAFSDGPKVSTSEGVADSAQKTGLPDKPMASISAS